MKSYAVVLSVVFVGYGFRSLAGAAEHPASRPAAQSATTAEDAAKQYVEFLRSGHGVEGVKKFWSFDRMFDGIFGEDMTKQTPAERAQMRDLMLTFLSHVYANPQVADLMSKATFEDFTSQGLPDHRARIDFTVNIASKKIANMLIMVKQGGDWRIMDAGVNNAGMVEALHKAYGASRDKMTPLEFVRAMTSGK